MVGNFRYNLVYLRRMSLLLVLLNCGLNVRIVFSGNSDLYLLLTTIAQLFVKSSSGRVVQISPTGTRSKASSPGAPFLLIIIF